MVGGVFEGTNGNRVTGTYTPYSYNLIHSTPGVDERKRKLGKLSVLALSRADRLVWKRRRDRVLSGWNQDHGNRLWEFWFMAKSGQHVSESCGREH